MEINPVAAAIPMSISEIVVETNASILKIISANE
jgi:hypothetical protein